MDQLPNEEKEVKSLPDEIQEPAQPANKPKEKKVVVQPFEQEKQKINYKYLGQHPFEINNEDDDISCIEGRIPVIQALDQCFNLKRLCLRTNLITKIEGLQNCVLLEELDLYDNRLVKIENLENLINLEILDLSFNNIKIIENLENQKKLRKLFLLSNKIKKVFLPYKMQIQNLDFPELVMLELGSNKIKDLENLDKLPSIKELFLGKNKISVIQNLEPLANSLELLSLSSNKIQQILPSIQCLINLNYLQIAENFILEINNLDALQELELLDLAHNKITKVQGIDKLQKLQDLWVHILSKKQLNNNRIELFHDFDQLQFNQSIKTIYIEQNPVAQYPDYKMKLLSLIPTLVQIDAVRIK